MRAALYARSLATLLLLLLPGRAFADLTLRVTASEAAIRPHSNDNSSIVATVRVGTILRGAVRDGDWYVVTLRDADGRQLYGYLPAQAVEVFEPQRESAAAPPPLTGANQTESPPERRAANEGFSFGFSVFNIEFGGGFNGVGVLSNESGFIVVPRLNADYGFGVSAGGRFAASAFEVTYSRSSHGFTGRVPSISRGRIILVPVAGRAVYHRVSIDAKGFLLARHRVQPYFAGGFAFPLLHLTDGGVVFGSVVDVKYSGVGVQGGGGIALYAHPRLALHGGVVYRYDLYGDARGGDTDWQELEKSIRDRGVRLVSGMTVTF
jgi:hypothetical protein